MTTFDDINNCQDFGIQAGSYIPIYFEFYYPNGNPLPLSIATKYGCTLSSIHDNNVPLVVITGKIDNSAKNGNVMVIDILSEYTKDLQSDILYYRPYVTIGENTYRWQGRITVGNTTPF